MDILNNLGLFGSGLILLITISGVFWKADDAFSEEFKEEIALHLLCLDISITVKSWPNYLASLFDNIFGEKHLSWKRFSRSCAASVIFYLLILMMCISISGVSAFLPWENNIEELLLSSVLFIVVNLIADYLSLIETRMIIGEMCKYDHPITVILFIFIDIFLTLSIFTLSVLMASFILFAISKITHTIITPILSIFYYIFGRYYLEGIVKTLMFKDYLPISVATYTTFITSVWIWLYALSQMLIRLSARAEPLLETIKHILPIETRPFRSIGIISGFIVCCLYWIIGTIVKVSGT